jgi:hypothetical protein
LYNSKHPGPTETPWAVDPLPTNLQR